jgi:hypothetical protein
MTKKLRKLTDAQCRRKLAEISHEVVCGCTERGKYLWEMEQDIRVNKRRFLMLMAIAMAGGPNLEDVNIDDKKLAICSEQIDRVIAEDTLMHAEPMGHA